jgi:hypothetical protein
MQTLCKAPDYDKGGSPRVIVAEPRPRRSNSDVTLQNPPPHIHEAPRSTIAEGDIEAVTTIQMQRLQEGSDAEVAIVSRPERTRFSPLDDSARGKDTTPPTGKAAPTGITVAKAFARGTL